MSALNFPDAPSPGQLFSPPPPAAGIWLWDGSKWVNGGGPNNYLLLNGGHLSNPGNLIIDGTLAVAGATTLVTINTSGAATLGSTLAVTGATTVGGTLAVSGATTLGTASGVTTPAGDNSISLATTAFVKSQGYATTAGVAGAYLPLSGGTSGGVTLGSGSASGAGNVTFSGNVVGNNSVQSNGVYFVNSSGWFYTPQNFVAGGAVAVSGQTGFNWQYSGGYMYCPNSVNVADLLSRANLNAQGGVVYLAGMYWQNNGGWMYCPWQTRTDGTLQAGGDVNAGGVIRFNGMYWQNNGGWAYCPWQVQSAGNVAAGGGAGQIGGWGLYTSFIDGNWHQSGGFDAFYCYTNTGITGFCYWDGSDERMKSNFGAIERDCLDAINAIQLQSYDFAEGLPAQRRTNPKEMRPEYFRWENLPRVSRHFESGFVAQQVREIIPEAVPEMQVEGAYLGVDMRPLVATLIGAVQQLTKRLAAMEDK